MKLIKKLLLQILIKILIKSIVDDNVPLKKYIFCAKMKKKMYLAEIADNTKQSFLKIKFIQL